MLSELPHLATLATAYNRLGIFIEVVFLGFRFCAFALCVICATFCLAIEECAEVETALLQELRIPLVSQEVEVIVAECVVVLDNIRLQLLDRRVRWEYLAGHCFKAQLLACSESHITAYNDKLLAVWVNYQLSEVEHFGVVLQRLDELLEAFVFDEARVAR